MGYGEQQVSSVINHVFFLNSQILSSDVGCVSILLTSQITVSSKLMDPVNLTYPYLIKKERKKNTTSLYTLIT